MSEVKRNANGFAVPRDPKRVPTGNVNPGNYRDGIGKTNAAPSTLLPNGENKYASDGLTIEWTPCEEKQS